jgi:Helix-turn-helix domain (DUF4817)
MNFSQEELIDMVYFLGAGDRNPFLASRMYAQQFPERRHPRIEAFQKLQEKFERTGQVKYEKKDREKRVTQEENELSVLLKVVENPHTSTRKISNELIVSQTSVSRTIRKFKFHPYHIQLVQELDQNDFQKRLQFSEWALEKLQQEYNFFDYVLFSDEATFHKNGYVNRHNFHYYDTVNPHFIRPVDHQHRWSLNVWAGIVGSCLIGPYFFDGNVNGVSYLVFFENQLPALLEDVPLDVRQRMWLQHDGAPPHYSRIVRTHLNRNFVDRWIGRGGPVGWPPRSPDLTKLDFFLWGHVRNMVYEEPPTTKENMMDRIRDAFGRINRNMLQNVNDSFLRRIQTCVQQQGGYIEHLV